ncbi:MAG TPA: NAD(P)/FAD-dependent oxidoreductase [Pyrinomonadaceae bacterium]|jgi:NADH dehydrogenase|nr:NAD(P)/FAD-dependent oxidoreductase [Pyrinomonadaceae bacterium]
MTFKKRILILGSGFGGLYTALHLDKTLAKDADVSITLVNRENFFLFTPMLHEVAASDLDITHIVSPVRKLLKRVKVFNGDVEGIDLHAKTVQVSHGKENHHHTLNYDHLVLSLGSITNFYGNAGLEANALTMKSLGDAIYLRNHMISNLEEADFECCPHVREPLLNFVVAGGGFAGVETIAGINDFLREALRFYPHLTEDMLRVVLVHGGDAILPELSPKLGKYAEKKLRKRGVEIHLNTLVSEATEREVVLSNGMRFASNTVIWTAGTAPNPLLDTLLCEKDHGKICANQFMEVEGFDGVWAVGDCSAIVDPKSGKTYPPTAQHAIRQGKVLAKNITAAIGGGRKKPFVFETIGQLAALGRRTGVAQIFGFNFSGFIAWWLWRTIYLMKLPRFEKKLRVALDWTLDLIFTKDPVQFLTLRSPTVSEAESNSQTYEAAA